MMQRVTIHGRIRTHMTHTRAKEDGMQSQDRAKRNIEYGEKLLRRWIKDFVRLVKLEQTLFAIPFAYVGVLLAGGIDQPLSKWVFVTLAVIGTRAAGMTLNRLVDYRYDMLNPRTTGQTLAARRMRTSSAIIIVSLSFALVAYSAYQLNLLCVILFPVGLFLFVIYPFVKRLTWWSHLFLGVILGSAAVGGWIGIRGTINEPILVLGAAVMFWAAGFDVIYACQDYEFDRRMGIRSIPVRFGIARAQAAALLFHLIMVVLFLAAGAMLDLTYVYYAGICVAALLLVYEHRLVGLEKKKYNPALFSVNAWISLVLFFFTLFEKVFVVE